MATSTTRITDILEHVGRTRKKDEEVSQMLTSLLPPDIEITADTLAEILGITEGRWSRISETERSLLLDGATTSLEARYGAEERWSRMAEFAAKYLPALIDKLLNPPPRPGRKNPNDPFNRDELVLYNPYMTTLAMVPNMPYLDKYWLSREKCAAQKWQLPGYIAPRILRITAYWDYCFTRDDKQTMKTPTKILGVLAFSLAGRVKGENRAKAIPRRTREGLKPWIAKWSKCDGDTGMICRFLYTILYEEDSEMTLDVVRLRMGMKAELCALPGCLELENLKVCGRCQGVKYCSPEHQREHWRYPWFSTGDHGHRRFCFKTEY